MLTIERRAATILYAATVLFIVDLFLGWYRTTVMVGGVVDVRATSSGWHGWGILAGILAIVLVLLAFDRGRLAHTPVQRIGVNALVSFGMLVTTLLAAVTDSAHVSLPEVGVTVEATLWPAWVGVALAAVAAAAAFAPLAAGEATPRHHAGAAA